MKIDDFIIEVKLVLNKELYEANLITYNQYIMAIKEIRKSNLC